MYWNKLGKKHHNAERMKPLLLHILTLPIDLFILMFIGTLLLTMRLFRMRWCAGYLPAYKACLVETMSLGLYGQA